MNYNFKYLFERFGLALWLVFLCNSLNAQIKLPRLISDGMILQRDADVKIWGWAGSNEKITIEFLGKTYTCSSNAEGEWSTILSGLKPGGPFKMHLNASDSVTINDVLVGDVWVCSGQSQIDIPMERVSPLYEEEIKKAGNSNIRYFQVPTVYDFNSPQKDLPFGKWESISQDNILKVSAIAYFFAEELYKEYKIPLGMVRSSLGGSPAEAWISEDALKKFPEHYEEAQKFKDQSYIEQIELLASNETRSWYKELNGSDLGYKNAEQPWFHPDIDISNWSLMNVPGYWADGDLGNVNGVLWFRKNVELSSYQAGKSAKLNLGRIIDADSVFVNGNYVGNVSYQYPPRRYKIPEGILKEGENTIVVRLINNSGKGGFVPDKPYELIVEDDLIDLKGEWHYKLGAKMPPMKSYPAVRFKPTGLFNGMISPLTDYAIKGIVWYQGESNAGRPKEYKALLPALINNWREKWQQGQFPFLFVQLPNYMESHDYPTESNWAIMRESQAHALSLPNTAMTIAIDLGEWNDIHPLNKKDVARRLALGARKIAYHENDLVWSGPLYKSMRMKGSKVYLSFGHIGGGLIVKEGKKLKQFAIAGEDKKFVWAEAKIKGNKVIVWNPKIKKPVSVRYAWADNPEGANLYNKEGLPASPFRTDDW